MEILDDKIESITSIIGLENINLTGNYINKNYIQKFIRNKNFIKKLKTIIIKDNSIGYFGFKEFSNQAVHFKNLTTINFQNNQIGDEGFKAFAA